MIRCSDLRLPGPCIVAASMFLFALTLLASVPAEAKQGDTVRVSVSSSGEQGNQHSEWSSISADGRYVAFDSWASTLVPGDTNGCGDVFVHDRATGATERVSVSSQGEQGNRGSKLPSISADGRCVGFQSWASNLVGGDTNRREDVFVHDRVTRQTERVSVSSMGEQGNQNSECSSISADGRYVGFTSQASNLVSGDTNGDYDIFVHDRVTRQTERVSVSSTGEQGNDDSGLWVSISAGGRYVAFASAASNFVQGDTNGVTDVFVHDRVTRQTERVSVSSDGEQGDYVSNWSCLSAEGRYVGFQSWASNLVQGDTNGGCDVFVHDRVTGATERVSVSSQGEQGNRESHRGSVSADGRYVTFYSYASNLVAGDTNGECDVFVHDRVRLDTDRASVSSTGGQGNGWSDLPAISAGGRYVALVSEASNLVPDDTNGYWDVFVHHYGSGSGSWDDSGEPPPPPGSLHLGNLHSHSSFSDGYLTSILAVLGYQGYCRFSSPHEAFIYAAINGVDFLAVTDHGEQIDDQEWDSEEAFDSYTWLHLYCGNSKGLLAQAEDSTRSSFVALSGFEWTKTEADDAWDYFRAKEHKGDGHINVIGSAEFTGVELESSWRQPTPTLADFYNWLSVAKDYPDRSGVVAQFNHPAFYPKTTHFDNFKWDARLDDVMALCEVGTNYDEHIGVIWYGAGWWNIDHYYEGLCNQDWYVMALNQGWHVAPTNNQDNHTGFWGYVNRHRTGVFVSSLSEPGIMSALRARRTFASEAPDGYIYYYANGDYFMGSGAPGRKPVPDIMGKIAFEIVADSADSIRRVLVFTNVDADSGVVHRGPKKRCLTVSAQYDANVGVWRATVPWAPSAWYFVRAQTYAPDRNLIYAAPVWTGRAPWPVARIAGRSWHNEQHTIVKVDVEVRNEGDLHAYQVFLDRPEVLWSSGDPVTFHEGLSGSPPYNLGTIPVGEAVTKPLYFNVPGDFWLFKVRLSGKATVWSGDEHYYSNVRLVYPPWVPMGSEPEDSWSVQLTPVSGEAWAEPGETAAWEYTATNDSPDKWLVLTGVSAGVWEKGDAQAVLENPLVPPGEEASGVLYEFTWDGDAPVGFGNTGTFEVEAAWFSDAGGQPGEYLGEAGSSTLPYSGVVAERASAPETFFNPGWNWFSIPMHAADADPSAVLGIDCGGILWKYDKYQKAPITYRPPFSEWELWVGDSYLLRLESVPEPPSYLGYEANHPFEYRLGRMGWTWLAMPRLDDMPGEEFMSTVLVEYPSGSGNQRTAQEDYNATPGNWINWAWSFYDSSIQAPKTFTPYAPFGNTTCQPWVGYRTWVKVGTAEVHSEPDQVTLIWP